MKIVIAEDDEVSRIVLKRTLELLDFEVVAMPDGIATWDYLRANETSILISDWMMPGMDGLEICRRLRAREDDAPYTYVILLTARHSREERLEALRAGADDLLAKPLDRAELLARINVARRIIAMEAQLRSRSEELERMHAELERKNSSLAEMASSDGLTGLKNHRYFHDVLNGLVSAAQPGGTPFSVVMIDVDAFKAFNDTFGHPAGDQALIEVARLLRANVREQDLLARYGGEEFAVLLPGADEEASCSLAERLRVAVQRHHWPLRPMTISLGVSTMERPIFRATDLIELADRSLYQSKAEGRNRMTHSRELSTFPEAGRPEAVPRPPDPTESRVITTLAFTSNPARLP